MAVFVSILSRLGRHCAVVLIFGLLCLPFPFSLLSSALAANGEPASPDASPAAAAVPAVPATAITPATVADDPDDASDRAAPSSPAAFELSGKENKDVPVQPAAHAAEATPSGMADAADAAAGQSGGNTKIVSEDSTKENADAPRAEPLPQPLATVAHCFDGDTFKLTDRRVVRLAGTDSPELSKGGRKGQFFAREARDQLSTLVKGQQVQLLQAGVKHRDPHGRILAEVLLPDGTSLNEVMIRNGAAYFYPHQDLNPHLQERLRSLQHEAIAGRRGMWAFLLSQPVAKNTYLGNKESLRFFPADCAEAQHIRPRNRVYFGNLMDAFMAGYAPARVCPFWPVTP